MMQAQDGDTVRTHFLTGGVLSTIDGAARGWLPQPYYRVEVQRPAFAAGSTHIVRLSEIRAITRNGALLCS